MLMANVGTVYDRLVQNSDLYLSASVSAELRRVPERSDDDTIASNPASSIVSTNARGPVRSGSKRISA